MQSRKTHTSESTSRNPASMAFTSFLESLLTLRLRELLSNVITCEMLATESLGRPLVFLDRKTLPGASANEVLEVTVTPMIVPIRLRLKLSD